MYKDSTLTTEDRKKIADFLKNRHIPAGLGTAAGACSIAAINLALTGHLTDEIPECMSPVIGRWIRRIQDSMPDSLRNSTEWKRLLPFAAGTGREKEAERHAIILDWMWGTVLPTLQPIADKRGFGAHWKAMTEGRTYDLAVAARAAASASYAASEVSEAASEASEAASAVASAAYSAAASAAYSAASYAAYAASEASAEASAEAWATFDPAGLLQRLIGLD